MESSEQVAERASVGEATPDSSVNKALSPQAAPAALAPAPAAMEEPTKTIHSETNTQNVTTTAAATAKAAEQAKKKKDQEVQQVNSAKDLTTAENRENSSPNSRSRKRKKSPGNNNKSSPARKSKRQCEVGFQPLDVELTSELKERLQSAQKYIDEEQIAKNSLEEAERQLQEAKQRVQKARERHQKISEQVSETAPDFSRDLMDLQGPWMECYKKLKSYREVKGHCLVRDTKNDPEMNALRLWTVRQRERYHLKDGNPNKLPWYLVRLLEELQFPWNYNEDTWMKHLNELQEFKRVHGHVRVPRTYRDNPTLAHWVKRMRHEGVKYQKDPTSSSLTKEQKQLLDDIGMVWENLRRPWNERFQDLLQFKADHGHCNVPKDHPNRKLVAWCQNQRAFYRAFLLGKKTFMDAARKKQLEDVGFCFGNSSRSNMGPLPAKKTDRNDKESLKMGGSDEEEEEEEDEADDALTLQPGGGMTGRAAAHPSHQLHEDHNYPPGYYW